MKAWVRREIGKFIGLATPDLDTDTPTNMRFGDEPDEGSEVTVSLADHRHGMPPGPHAIIDALLKISFTFSESAWFDAAGPFRNNFDGETVRIGSGATFGGLDDPDSTGGYGTMGSNLGIASPSQASGYACIQQNDGSSNDVEHDISRLAVFRTRARFGQGPVTVPAGYPVLSRCVVGGIATVVDATATGWLTAITDGLYFLADVVSSSDARWLAVATKDLESTTVNTGVDLSFSGLEPNFQTFEIRFDGETATYFIDTIQVATITTTIPTGKVAGFGTWMEHPSRANTNHTVTESIMVQSRRL